MTRGSGPVVRTMVSLVMIVMTFQVLLSAENSVSAESSPFHEALVRASEQILSVIGATVSLLLHVVPPLIAVTSILYLLIVARNSPHSIWTAGIEGRPLDVEAVDLGDHDDAECLTCGRDDGPGVRRGYVEEFVLAGLPVWEADRSETHDCAAHTDRAGLEALGDEDEERDGLDVALDATSETDEDEKHDEIIEGTAVAGHPFSSSHWDRSSVETDEDGDAR